MHFKIHGMDCAEEIAVLKSEVGPVVGGEEYLSFDLLHGRMTIRSGPEEPTLEAILQAIAQTGMQAEVWREGSETPREEQGWQRHGRAVLTGASGLSLADAVRPEARQALQALRAVGIRRLVMLTGDNEGTAQAIGREAGIDQVFAELLPAHKEEAVASLVSQCGQVAMVGDGVNDAPAMARATLGIAMGATGSDTAIETADIALMSDDLSKLPWLIRHSRHTLSIIHQNITFSLSVKLLFVALTFLGHASLWAAIGADMGASLLVIFNGLRLLRPVDS